MKSDNDVFSRNQVFFGLIAGSFMICLTLLLIAHAVVPAYAAAVDVKGSPNVAIAAFTTMSSNSQKMNVEVVYADGHVSDATGFVAGTPVTFSPPPMASTGGMVYQTTNVPGGFTFMYALGSDRQLYRLDPSSGGWQSVGAQLP